MYEEDRERALDLYGDIFDEADNDTAVLQLLVSPTRQAVNLARAYDAKDRSGQAAGTPAYLGVIDELRSQAGSLFPAAPKVDNSQISLFSEPEHNENVFDSFGFDLPAEDAAEEPAEEPGNELPDELPDGLSRFPDEDSEEDAVLPPPVPVLPTEEPEEKTPEQELDEFADSVAAFLSDFSIPADGSEEKSAQEAPAAPAPEAQEPVQRIVEPDLPVKTPIAAQEIPARPNVPEIKETRPVVGLLILFIILAIPVGLLGIGLLLVLALLSLGLAACTLAAGFYGLVTAFTSFGVFADILLVFGLALAAAAVGLLLFWLFVWLVFGVIPDLVRGLCRLARKLCYKEVTL